ncbi:arsenate reductase ArsC [Methyloversatilis discipulorum]|uniref:arsenate reductase ArsC n=1 Tax=Methyloversatilis discipulorum TaxID=1119528 RepID=UPI00037055F6|nr:arsenate reductase ArsC [Methyloversatilis discipulorum]
MARPLNVLFLCTHNSARSVLAECLLNHLGGARFRAFSAGSQPSGRVNPFALQALAEQGIDTTGVRSKAWDEFAAPGAPTMDLIITVCDSAAGETCPVWPGHPATAHWGYADPSATTGSDAAKLTAFRDTLALIRRRLEILVAMPDERLHALALQQTARDLAAH